MNEHIEALDLNLGKGGIHTIVNGEISEAKFLLESAKRSWSIAVPFGRARVYDFLAQLPNEGWKSIQVKTVYVDKQGNGRKIRVVSVRKGLGKNYASGDFDYLFAASEQCCWLIPWEEIKDKKSNISLENKVWDKFILGD